MMSRHARQLIVNADDFGISRGVNRGIVEAHRHGLVTSASLMANLPSAEDALTRATTCPDLGLGLHLTLTAGRPLSRPDQVPTLVDADGGFFLLGVLLTRLSTGRVSTDELRRELTLQVEWALQRGVQPDHLDAHHHVHIHPRVAPVVIALAREHGIGWVRSPVEGGPSPALLAQAPRDAVRTVAISTFGMLTRVLVRQAGLRSTRHFRGIGMGMGFDEAVLLRALDDLPTGLTELMTHPGHPDDELVRLTSFSEGRDRELAALTGRAASDRVRERRIRLVRYRPGVAV
ncbi:MAG: ChbG/HpnK family deacetylase [Chloroflexi bacterium]|nr:ChbG/HpnK family deacetylase [Chloroflexota bacterium]